MPPVVCSRLCNKDSAWVGVFARNKSEWSASVMFSAGYRLLLAFLA